jgi:hypothetical protein
LGGGGEIGEYKEREDVGEWQYRNTRNKEGMHGNDKIIRPEIKD